MTARHDAQESLANQASNDVGDTALKVIADRLKVLAQGVSIVARLGGKSHTIGVSIGIARSTDEVLAAGDLLRRADVALCSAKSAGRNRTERYQSHMETRLRDELEVRLELQRAIAEHRSPGTATPS